MTAHQAPAAPAQRRMWFLDQMMPGLTAYNVPWVIRISGDLDVAALRAALTAAVTRHEAWRTVLAEVSGEPVQRVLPPFEVFCPLVALPTAQAWQRVKELAREPFDLAAGPLLRICLISVAEKEHLLVIVFHHIVVDGWSFQLFFDELLADYEGRPVPAPPLQYPDFAAWEAARPADVAAEQYWREALAGVESIVEFPADRKRPAAPSFAGGLLDFEFRGAERVKEFARSRGTTPFTVLLAAVGATVARFTGRDDLLIGVPVNGRTAPGTEHTAGLFTNTLPVRQRVAPATTFDELLAATRATLVQGMEHQDIPFERIADLALAERGLGWSPLVQLLFQWEELPGAVEAGGLRWEPELQDNGGSKLDFSLSVLDRDGVLSGRITYAADLFDEATVSRFADCWLTLVDAVLDSPSSRHATLPLTSPGELGLVTGAWAFGGKLPPGPPTAIELLVAEADPVRWERVARVAGALRELGAGPEVNVGLSVPRGPDLIDALLGIWWAGAAYVPLDPAYPQARLDLMVADAGVQIVLGAGSFPGARMLSLETALNADPVARQDIPANVAAYTIFTSGSTGRPKGVTVTQENVASMLRAFQHRLGLGGQDHLVAITTIAFDISVLELLLPLVCGAQVTVASPQTAADPLALRELLERVGATALQATPATWRGLTLTGGVPSGVRIRLCGGEALPPDLAAALAGPEIELWNVYGPTETTVWSAAGDSFHIGPALPGTHIYVLDESMNPVPPGVTGQLFIGGPGVSRGYHGRPALTAQKFVPSPFGAGKRLYATGDIARWLSDGKLEFLGRQDQQIKIRGYRIELDEIEAVLRELPGVSDAVVTVSSHGGDRRLAAYVVGDTDGLRERLAERLPEYMLPTVFVALPELPRTLNAKTDRKALPEPEWSVAAQSREPRTELELQLARMWQELLATPGLPGADDNFFALGGHSLTATRLLARVRTEIGVLVPLVAFFRLPTVAALAIKVAAGSHAFAPLLSDQLSRELDDDDLDALFEELTR